MHSFPTIQVISESFHHMNAWQTHLDFGTNIMAVCPWTMQYGDYVSGTLGFTMFLCGMTAV